MKVNIIASVLVLSALPLLASNPAWAGKESGGGTGCMAEIERAALVVSDWLETKGSSLKPSVSANQFLNELSPNGFVFVGKDVDLQYLGNPADAFFNGSVVQVRCDRFEANTIEGRERVIAHEIFRKLGLEGKDYEISKQIPFLAKDTKVIQPNLNGKHFLAATSTEAYQGNPLLSHAADIRSDALCQAYGYKNSIDATVIWSEESGEVYETADGSMLIQENAYSVTVGGIYGELPCLGIGSLCQTRTYPWGYFDTIVCSQ